MVKSTSRHLFYYRELENCNLNTKLANNTTNNENLASTGCIKKTQPLNILRYSYCS